MNNFIFKSPRRLIKNKSINLGDIMYRLNAMQEQLRLLRSDNHEMTLKLEKLLIDKHLQMQVDEYFTHGDHDEPEPPEDIGTRGE